MDPLGLALENFDALGRWREQGTRQSRGFDRKLITGESFSNVQELKRILADEHRRDFFRCLSEKMLTYALGAVSTIMTWRQLIRWWIVLNAKTAAPAR